MKNTGNYQTLPGRKPLPDPVRGDNARMDAMIDKQAALKSAWFEKVKRNEAFIRSTDADAYHKKQLAEKAAEIRGHLAATLAEMKEVDKRLADAQLQYNESEREIARAFREAARAAGEGHYISTKLCVKGHLSYRYTSVGTCVECDKSAKREKWMKKFLAREAAGKVNYGND